MRGMDTELLRKQIAGELQAQYESKLREVKRQKTSVEEELENASERWRTERRRLHAEIDRLEAALAEAKAPALRKAGVVGKSVGPEADSGKPQASVQEKEKLAKAAAEWDAERSKLLSQISRLEGAVAEAIERSNNPLRSTASIKDQYEARLQQAAKERTALEQDFLREKALWDEDKKKLTSEIVKLRRLGPSSKALEIKEKLDRLQGRESDEEVRIRELGEKLSKAHEEVEKYHRAWLSAGDEIRKEFEPLLQEARRKHEEAEGKLATATKDWQTERAQLRTENAQLRQNFTDGQQDKLTEFQAAAAQWAQEHKRLDGEIQRLGQIMGETRSSYETRLDEVNRQRLQAEQQLETAGRNWETERLQLRRRIDELQQALDQQKTRQEVSPEIVDQLRRQYDVKIQEMIKERTAIAEQLQRATSLLQTERARFAKEISKASSGSGETGGPSPNSGEVDAEVQRVKGMIQVIVHTIDDPATELSTVIRKNVEKAELDAYLHGIHFALGRAKSL